MSTLFKRIHNDLNLALMGKMQTIAQKYEGSRYYYSVWVDNKTKSLYTVLVRAMEDEDLPVLEVSGADHLCVGRIEKLINEKYESELTSISENRHTYQKTKLAHVMTNGF